MVISSIYRNTAPEFETATASPGGMFTDEVNAFLADAQTYVNGVQTQRAQLTQQAAPAAATTGATTVVYQDNSWNWYGSSDRSSSSNSSWSSSPASSSSSSRRRDDDQDEDMGGGAAALLAVIGLIALVGSAIGFGVNYARTQSAQRRLGFLDHTYRPIGEYAGRNVDDRSLQLIQQIYQARHNVLAPRVVSNQAGSGLAMGGMIAGVATVASAYFRSNDGAGYSLGALGVLGVLTLIKWAYDSYDRSSREDEAIQVISRALAELRRQGADFDSLVRR
jgi:hypothetical protein